LDCWIVNRNEVPLPSAGGPLDVLDAVFEVQANAGPPSPLPYLAQPLDRASMNFESAWPWLMVSFTAP
jgi:hypothetical protein